MRPIITIDLRTSDQVIRSYLPLFRADGYEQCPPVTTAHVVVRDESLLAIRARGTSERFVVVETADGRQRLVSLPTSYPTLRAVISGLLEPQVAA